MAKLIHTNQKEIAEALHLACRQSQIVQLIMPMQSGKTGVVWHFANNRVWEDRPYPQVGFVCAMSFLDLREQNKRRLEAAFYNMAGEFTQSKIKVFDEELFKQRSIPELVIRQLEYLVIDECDWGTGNVGRLARKLDEILSINPTIKIILISATPYESLLAGLPMTIVQGTEEYMTRHGYCGLQYFLENGQVVDNKGKAASLRNKQFIESVNLFKSSRKNKYYLIRTASIRQAEILASHFSSKLSTRVVHMGGSRGIKYELDKLKTSPDTPTLVFVVNSLSAGIDLEEGKQNIWGVWETRKQVSGCAQGLPGRVCSYQQESETIIYAEKSLLEKASLILNSHKETQNGTKHVLSPRIKIKEQAGEKLWLDMEMYDIDRLPARIQKLLRRDKEGRFRKATGLGNSVQLMMTSLSRGGGTKKTSADSRIGTKLQLFTDYFTNGKTDRGAMFRRNKDDNLEEIETCLFINDVSKCRELGLEIAEGQDNPEIADKVLVMTRNKVIIEKGSLKTVKSMYNNLKHVEEDSSNVRKLSAPAV